jgi:nucleoside-diphosphate-sugar epimerase
MRILLAGATGAIGRPLLPRLVAAGHEVTGLTRRPERVAQIEAAGARGVVCDVKDRQALLDLVAETGPDVVMDQTTDLPQRYDPSRMDRFYEDMLPLRLRGTPNVFEAAASCGARLFFQSIAFLYAANGRPAVVAEDAPTIGADGPPPWNLAMPVITALEQRAVDQGGVVLRYGWFYGPGTHFDEGQTYEDVRRRRLPVVGNGAGLWSFIHVDDAAEATVRALDWPGSGIFNVVDDEPMPARQWIPAYAKEIGAKRPFRVPAFLARRVAGEMAVHTMTTLPGASNAKARSELGWRPGHSSVRTGFQER